MFTKNYIPLLKKVFLFFLTTSIFLQAQTLDLNDKVSSEPTIFTLNDNTIITKLAGKKSATLELPNASGNLQKFSLQKNNTLSQGFLNENPNIGSFDITNHFGGVIGKLTYGDSKIYIIYDTPIGLVTIRPSSSKKEDTYEILIGDDTSNLKDGESGHLQCSQAEECPNPNKEITPHILLNLDELKAAYSIGENMTTYRVALAVTGEFYVQNGNAAAAVNTVITNTVNAWNLIFEKEIGATFTIVPSPVLYTDPATDPFIPEGATGSGGDGRTNQAAEAISMNFALADYDIGHVFHYYPSGSTDWSGGGVAGLGVVCGNTDWTLGDSDAIFGARKGAGWSGSFDNTSNGWVQLSAHEVAHMFGAEHTFNGTGNNCTSAISNTTAYEIGSGTTIMSYDGICGAGQNIGESNAVSNNYFHTHSLSQMITYMAGAGCGAVAATGNTAPTINADICGADGATIPLGTPFTLEGSGSDNDGDALTYTWEQYDEDGAGTTTQGLIGAAAGANADAPLFRSYPPSSDPSRTFPDISYIKSGTDYDFEVLPTVPRTLNFVLTARDCNSGVACADISLNVGADGPLTVADPASCPITAGNTTTITWNTNGSDAYCNNVDVMMSIDGGCTFPYTLASGVAYSSGTSGSVPIPAGTPNTTNARFKVICADNPCATFFAMSPADCAITNATCGILPNVLCKDDACSLPLGDAGLNLSVNSYYGGVNGTVTVNASGNQMDVTTNSNTVGTCLDHNFDVDYGIVEFSVSATGTYSVNSNASIFEIVNIFSAPFSETDPCSTWLAGNTVDGDGAPLGSVSSDNPFTINLTECTDYIVTMSGYSSTFTTGTLSINGAGSVIIKQNTPPAPDDGYTYIAVNETGDIVDAVDANSDFTNLPAGCYNVYGVSYNTGIDTTTWRGNPLSSILSGGDCMLPSSNRKPLKVTTNCNITGAGLANVVCNDNSTDLSTDDFISFDLNPTTDVAPYTYTTYNVTVSIGSVTPTSGTYGGVESFQLQGGSAGGGDVTVTITDANDPTCTFDVVITDTGACSYGGLATGPAGADPCSCNGDQTADGAQDGTFDEVAAVTGTDATQTWTVQSVASLSGGTAPTGIAVNDVLTFNAGLNQHETATFSHTDDSGYVIVVEGPAAAGTAGNITVNISNLCEYPEIECVPTINSTYAATDPTITLGVNEINSNPGTDTYTINTVGTTTLNPSTLGAGNHTLVATFDGTFVDNSGGTVANPAYPGCETSETKNFCISPTVTGFASCTTGASTDVAENTYLVKINIDPASILATTTIDVTIGGNTQSFSYDPAADNATFDYIYTTAFTHSGTGNAVQTVTVMPQGASCGATFEVTETLCIDVDDDGTLDNNTSACNCDVYDPPGVIISQAQPGTFVSGGTSGLVQIYVLTDGSGNIVADGNGDTFNETGLFVELNNGNYEVNSVSVTSGDFVAFTGGLTVGTDFDTYVSGSSACQSTCGNAPYTVNCLCFTCPEIGGLTDPTDICEGGTFDLVATGLDTMAMVINTEADFGINFVYFNSATQATTPTTAAVAYSAPTGTLGTVPNASLTGTNPNQTATLSSVGAGLVADTYQICAILDPVSSETTCRPFQCVEVVINENPTITLGASPSVCFGTLATTLPYTATTNSPNQYSIDFDGAAEFAGFVDVPITALPVSPINITIPNGAVAATYNATITVTNSTTTCSSVTPAPFTVTINALPTANNPDFLVCSAKITAVDLTDYDTSVNATETVTWWNGQPSAAGTQITPATSVDLTTITNLWAQVSDGTCINEVQVTHQINDVNCGGTFPWNGN